MTQLYHWLFALTIDVILSPVMNKSIWKNVFLLASLPVLLGGLFLFVNTAKTASFTPYFSDTGYGGKYVSQSVLDPIIIPAGGSKEVVIKVKNTGKKIWTRTGSRFVSIYTVDPKYRESEFYGKGWIGKDQPARVSADIKSGETGDFTIKLYAPDKTGNYEEKFYLASEDLTWIKGSYFFLKIKVTPSTVKAVLGVKETASATTTENTEVLVQEEEEIFDANFLQSAGEPNIRVGLYKTADPVKFVSDFDYNIYAGGDLQGVVPAGQTATLKYTNSTYFLQAGELKLSADEPWRFIPNDPSNFFTLTNYTRQMSGKGKRNFNAYRGTLEYAYSVKSDLPYIINELPLYEYVAVIADPVNTSPMEYIKALLVAARSYAFTSIDPPNTKNKSIFDVYATTVDQLYLGYNSEIDMPRIKEGADATYGEMVTHGGTPVRAPYFANSNGQTKLWSAVWGGANKPWIQSVECVYDKGMKQYGHGVGMSNRDAMQRVIKDGWTYDQVLKYYYAGVEVERVY